MNVSEYWLISAPGDRTCQETWDRLNQVNTAFCVKIKGFSLKTLFKIKGNKQTTIINELEISHPWLESRHTRSTCRIIGRPR